ncbi:MAG: cytochrome P450 [Alphaproteobacteria bacterium]
MGHYLERLKSEPEANRWRLVRHWLFTEPQPFFAEMRVESPVLALPELTLLFRHADCTRVLRSHDVFVVDLEKPKQGGYFMAQDDTAVHWREKSLMKTVLDREDLPKIREWVAAETAKRLAAGGGRIEMISGLSRAVPIALVQTWFGFSSIKAERLQEWSYWNQQDAFWNQPFDDIVVADPAAIVAKRNEANVGLAIHVGFLVARRWLASLVGWRGKDVVSRIVRLSRSGAVRFSLKDVVFNVGGLLIGAVETTSHTTVNALDTLTRDPALLARAIAAAKSEDTAAFDGYVFEALRFRPAFPYFFRTCHAPMAMAVGTPFETTIPVGATVLAVTHSAMFDPLNVPEAEAFDPARAPTETFTFGFGLHECLGRGVASVMVPEILRQILRAPDIQALGRPDFKGGPVPEKWDLTYRV